MCKVAFEATATLHLFNSVEFAPEIILMNLQAQINKQQLQIIIDIKTYV